MLDSANDKGTYTSVHKFFLGAPDDFPQEHRDKYDCVTSIGILAEGHLSGEVFKEMLLAAKTGALIIFSTREMYLEKYGYGADIKSHEDAGRWQKVTE